MTASNDFPTDSQNTTSTNLNLAISWVDDFQPEVFGYYQHICPVCVARAQFHQSVEKMTAAFDTVLLTILQQNSSPAAASNLLLKFQTLSRSGYLAVAAHRATDAVNRTIWEMVEEDNPEQLSPIGAKAYYQYQAYEEDCFKQAEIALQELTLAVEQAASDLLNQETKNLGAAIASSQDCAKSVWQALAQFTSIRKAIADQV